jgi:hypothetical protein
MTRTRTRARLGTVTCRRRVTWSVMACRAIGTSVQMWMRGHRRGFRVPGRCRRRRRVIALELEDGEVRDERSQWQAVVHLTC